MFATKFGRIISTECVDDPFQTPLMHRANLLGETKSKGRTSKCKVFLTVEIFSNYVLNWAEGIILEECISF
jgi:hypothetical protein